MKSLSGLSPGTFGRSLVFLVILSALLLTGCERISASTTLEISKTVQTSPIESLMNSKKALPMAGQAFVPSRRSIGQPDRSMNFIDYETPLFSARGLRSVSSSEVPIVSRSHSSEISTIFTSRNSPITRASRSESFSPIPISKTVQLSSAARQAMNWKLSDVWRVRGSQILPIDKRRPLFKPPCSECATGPTSEAWTRQRSSWRESSLLSTLGPPNYARSSTERSFALGSPRTRFRGSTNWSPVNSLRSFMNRRSAKLFPKSRSQL
jgi:hypothetical protein